MLPVPPTLPVVGVVDGDVIVAQNWAAVSPSAAAALRRFRKATEWLAAWEPLEAA